MSVSIRAMIPADIDALPTAFAAQGWNKSREQFDRYYKAQQAGEYAVIVAEADGEVAGYVLLKPRAGAGPYVDTSYPEIVDFNVLQKFQRRGIGSALLDEAEARANGPVTLGVGLHAGYGTAQRMYARRGYVPAGDGVWYGDKPLEPYTQCVNDDDLVLYMAKGLG